MFCLDLYGDVKNKEGLLLGQGVSPPCDFTQDWFPQLCVLAQKTASKIIKVWTSPKQQVHKVQCSNTRLARCGLECKAECCLGTVRYMQYLMAPHFTAVKSKLVSYTAAKHIVCLVKKNKRVKNCVEIKLLKMKIKMTHSFIAPWRWSSLQTTQEQYTVHSVSLFIMNNIFIHKCSSWTLWEWSDVLSSVTVYAEKKSFPLFHGLLGNNMW